MRSFNTTGPCIPDEHYMLNPEDQCLGVMDLILRRHFFVIHAPRQTGKTTLLKSLARQLNSGNELYALYCSLECAQGIDELKEGMSAVLRRLAFALEAHPGLARFAPDAGILIADPTSGLLRYMIRLVSQADKPVVVFFDETDCLGGATLISFLRQLRDGYVNRGDVPFLHSLALVGMRNIRDFKVHMRDEGKTLGSSSPFNIAKESLTLTNFTREEIAALYRQHTQETGQVFPPNLMDTVFEMTQGQPWLVNAIAAEMVEKLCKRDFKLPLTVAMAEEAIQRIILRRETHIDSLLERLQEERVQKIIEPVLLGEGESIQRLSNDFQFVRDLGLIREDQGVLRIANPIYNEVIARTLNADIQMNLSPELIHRWMDAQSIDMTGLLTEFQRFWRDNSEAWTDRFQYKEAAPHLILMGFLQRVINGGAKIDREFATGTRRVDICVQFAKRRYPIELKLVRSAKTREEGVVQLAKYMNTLGVKEGWLLLFDIDSDLPWEQRLYWKTIQQEEMTLHLVGV